LRKFYEQGEKQVIDVHNEARHLANLKSGKPSASAAPPTEYGTNEPPAAYAALEPTETGAIEKPADGDKKV
jgi:hypothetical protein